MSARDVVTSLAYWPGDVTAAWRQATATRARAHRAEGLASGPWVMGQSWEDLLFAHWRLPVEAVRPAVPKELEIDTFDGSAWVGVTPFLLTGFRLRATLPAPVMARFPELNVRTYVTQQGDGGIWFFSLDAGSTLTVHGARRLYRLPYFRADMHVRRRDGWVQYRSTRDRAVGFEASYRPVGAPSEAAQGTLEHWLTERYRLFALDDDRRVHAAEIHHRPWTLQAAEARIGRNTMLAPQPFELPAEDPLLHFSERQDVVIWPLRRRKI